MSRLASFRTIELPAGEIKRVQLEGRPAIAVYNLAGEFHATDDTCTHGEASLAEGMIEGVQIICPYHGGAFDIRSGQVAGPPCAMPLRTYPLVVEDGIVYLANKAGD